MWDPSTIAVNQADLRLMLDTTSPAPRRCCLVVYSGPELGRQIQLDEGLASLGRSAAAHLQIEGAGLSRLHAEIQVSGSQALLRDLESVNGTFVHDRQLGSAAVPLRDGDLLRLGSVLLRFYQHGSLDALLHDRVYRLAMVDPGTNLFNRRYLLDALKRAWRQAHQGGLALSLISYDMDHFKAVNDGYGHGAGDAVLQRSANVAAAVVQAAAGEAATLGRIGGEEFAVLLPGLDLERARALAERLRSAVAAQIFQFNRVSGADASPVAHHQTISLGVASLQPGLSSESDLLAAADRLLYQAKLAGRNRVSG